MKKLSTLIFGITAIFLLSAPAMADHHGGMATKMGKASLSVLTDTKGMSLYTFDKDTAGVSNCNGKCAEKWPPLFAKNGAKSPQNYSIIKRADGKMQWAYKGQALYLWFKDKKPGDVTGDGVKGVWHIARP